MTTEYREVAATELRDHASEIVNRVAFGNEELVLTRHGSPVAALVSLAALERLHKFEDAEDVAEAERARKDVRKRGSIPWDEVRTRSRRRV